jgi:tetratricopeptide (TPR) repeat protein
LFFPLWVLEAAVSSFAGWGGFDFRAKALAKAKKGKPQMNLTETQVGQTCALVSDLIYAGQFEEAREELGELWPGLGKRPEYNFNPLLNAELLLQCGTLTGWLGSAKQMNVQEKAMDLITEALEIFQSLNNQTKIAESQYELGMCYWRSGALDEARIVLQKAMELGTHEQRGKILVRQTIVEISSGRYHEALTMLDNARASFESYPHALKGRWHSQKALILKRLAGAESRPDYYDRALVEFTAAIIHLEEAGHRRYQGNNLNNLAFVLCKMGQYREAHDHLNRARIIFEKLQDPGNIAQVEETRARVLLGEGRYLEAEIVINEVVESLEKSGEQALLTDALIVKATVQARLGNQKSVGTFNHAIKVGEVAGARCSAGLAAVGLIEEHGKSLSVHEIFKAYRSADSFLYRVQDLEAINRLRGCARIFVSRLCERGSNFHLQKAVLEYEAHFIQQALEEEEGRVTNAARKLGLTHQGLGFILETRHQKLSGKRIPPKKRRRSLMKKPAK